MPALKELSFSDLDLTFTAHPITGNLTVLKNLAAIKQSVKNLVLTNLGERPFLPDIGSDVRRSLFENFGPITASIIKQNIRRVLTAYEPRIHLIDVLVKLQMDHNKYGVKIIFRAQNLTSPVEVDLFLERVR